MILKMIKSYYQKIMEIKTQFTKSNKPEHINYSNYVIQLLTKPEQNK